MDSAPGKIRSSSIFKTIMTFPIFKPIRFIFAVIACILLYRLKNAAVKILTWLKVSSHKSDIAVQVEKRCCENFKMA